MAAADPLCRELTAAERMWLPQTSLVAVTLQITAAVAEVTSIEKLKEALEVSRAKQPFLCVCIDAEDVRFQRVTGPVPLTSETLETSAMEDVRAATRKRLQEGLDRHESFGRAHLVKTPNATFLSVYGDHLCFDAKSFVIWATTTLAALAGDPLGELTALDFVDWTTRIPSRTFEPLVYPFDSLMLKTLAPNPDEDAGSVTSFVETIPRDLFIALKARTKELGSRLNAPLMVAFFAAIADVARHQQPDLPAPLNIRSVCAVDLRTYVEPPLPIDYMNNSAAVVPASASFPNVVPGEGGITGDLWPIAKAANQGVVDAIANGEGFRLNDITKRGAFAEMGPYFAIPCLWSNVGHIATPHAEAAETMISGAATNPVVTGHCTEAGNVLALTITYAPNLHEESAMRLVAQRFRHHVTSLATTPS